MVLFMRKKGVAHQSHRCRLTFTRPPNNRQHLHPVIVASKEIIFLSEKVLSEQFANTWRCYSFMLSSIFQHS